MHWKEKCAFEIEKMKKLKTMILYVLFAIVCCSVAMFIVIKGEILIIPKAITYISYVFAAISFFFATLAIAIFIQGKNMKVTIHEILHKKYFTGRIYDDYSFRTVVFTYGSLATNILLAITKGIAGVYTISPWLITLAAYYLVLCIAKFFLLKVSRRIEEYENEKEKHKKEWKVFRFCGILFFVLTVVLEGVTILILKNGDTFFYDGMVLILAVATYDFFCMTNSIIHLIKTRKNHSPIIVSIKMINFVAALVAILALQTAMFVTFGDETMVKLQLLMNALTGTVVSFIILALGIIMVRRGKKELLKINEAATMEELYD